MLVYLGVDFLIISLGLLLAHSRASFGRKTIDTNELYFILVGFVLFFVSAFRGDFSADYNGYAKVIWLRFSEYSIMDIINRGYASNPEPGYLIFQRIIRLVTNNSLYIFIISSLLIVVSNIKEIKRSQALPFLCVFLFVEVGSYYESFNLMRQLMSVSIVIIGSKYLFEKNFFKYAIFVFIASTFHIAALVMIPFYFICGLKLEKKSLIIYPTAMFLMLFAQERLISITGRYLWTWYDVNSGGYSWNNVIGGGIVSVLALVLYYSNSLANTYNSEDVEYAIREENIYLTSTYLWLLFLLMGLHFSYAKRFSSYFSLYAICFCCKQIERNKLKNLIIISLIFIFIVFGFITKMKIPYYFIWDR